MDGPFQVEKAHRESKKLIFTAFYEFFQATPGGTDMVDRCCVFELE